jgi:hypothetical protein
MSIRGGRGPWTSRANLRSQRSGPGNRGAAAIQPSGWWRDRSSPRSRPELWAIQPGRESPGAGEQNGGDRHGNDQREHHHKRDQLPTAKGEPLGTGGHAGHRLPGCLRHRSGREEAVLGGFGHRLGDDRVELRWKLWARFGHLRRRARTRRPGRPRSLSCTGPRQSGIRRRHSPASRCRSEHRAAGPRTARGPRNRACPRTARWPSCRNRTRFAW